MRYNSNRTKGASRYAQGLLKAVLIILLFSLIFTSVLTTLPNGEILDTVFAAAGVEASNGYRAATKIDVSSLSDSGTNVAKVFNDNQNSTYAAKFGVSSEVANGKNDFGWNSAEGAWGFTDWAGSDDAAVWWIEFKFSSTALTAVSKGRASFYASATSKFSDGTNDECSMGISFVGVQERPHVKFIDSGRLFSNANWSSSASLAYKSDWTDDDSVTFTHGASGGFNSSYAIPTNATGIRMVFAAIADGAMDGGFYDLNLTLYKVPDDTMISSNSTFSLADCLYGETYKIAATSENNWSKTDDSKSGMSWINKVAASPSSPVSHGDNGNLKGSVNYAGAGILAKTGTNNASMTSHVTTTIKVPGYATKVEISGRIEFGMLAEWAYSANKKTTVDTNVVVAYGSSTKTYNAPQLEKNNSSKNTKNTNYLGTDTNFSKTFDTAPESSSEKSITIKLTLAINKTDASGGSDTFYAWSTVGNIKVKFTGPYSVIFHKNDGTATTETVKYLHGITDSSTATDYGNPTRTSSKNYGDKFPSISSLKWTNGDKTFTGWSLSSSGSIVYDDSHNTATTELTNVPSTTIHLYAIWLDSDFGSLNGDRGTTWGTESNPFVISKKEHWMNLVDIVNKNREPFDSVDGTHFGKYRNTNASYTSFSDCYFIVTKDIDIGTTTPVGNNADDDANSAQNFKGTIYGYNTTTNEKTPRTLTVTINNDSTYTGLFNYLNGATVEYLTVAGQIKSTGMYVGGIAGAIYMRSADISNPSAATTIKNCTVTANVIGASFNEAGEVTGQKGVGGIVGSIFGNSRAKIIDCTCNITRATFTATNKNTGAEVVNANIYGGQGTAAIVGYIPGYSEVSITNAKLISGKISNVKDGTSAVVGYLEGSATLTVSGVTISGGTLDGMSGTAGVVGYMTGTADATISGVVMTAGSISGDNGVAGVAGYLADSAVTLDISVSKVTGGTISGRLNVGAIGGRIVTKSTTANSVLISNVYNSGTIKSTEQTTGGIVGYLNYAGDTSSSTILLLRYAYNGGTVNGNGTNQGGIVGKANGANPNNSILLYCYNAGKLNNDAAGYVVGTGTHSVSNCWQFAGTSKPTGTQGEARLLYFGSGLTTTVYPASSNSDESGTSWESIAELNTDSDSATPNNYTYFRLFDETAGQTIANGSYLKVFNESTSGRVTLSTITVEEINKDGNDTSAAISVKNAIFSASLTIPILKLEKGTFTNANTAKTITYGDTAVTAGHWIASNNSGTGNNAYTSSASVKYYNSGWTTTVPTQAGEYSVKTYLYNNAHFVGVKTLVFAKSGSTATKGYLINQKALTITAKDTNNAAFSQGTTKNYTYNKAQQGLATVTVAGLVNGEVFSSIFDYSVSAGNMTVTANNSGASVSTVNAGSYTFTLSLKANSNYKISSGPTACSWVINPKDLSELDFGYGTNGIAAGGDTLAVGGNNYYKLNVEAAPYSLVYRDSSTAYYKNVSKYNIFFDTTVLSSTNDYTLLVSENGTTCATPGGVIQFSAGAVSTVEMTFTGKGNYTGERTVKFSLLDSDFGGNFTQADWGSEGNPYLIENAAHLVRLSQIVNGAQAWNSINNASQALAANSYAKATDRTYSGAVFKLTANLDAASDGGFTGIGNGSAHPFSGSFDGQSKYIRLAVTAGGNYSGLFGYLSGASISNLEIRGSVTAGNYVGNVAGYAENSTLSGNFTINSSVKGNNFVGGLVGKWIVNDPAQVDALMRNGIDNPNTVFGLSFKVEGDSYVGGLAGWFDAHGCSGLELHPVFTNGDKNSPICVVGQSYTGALFGGFEGHGYKRSSKDVSAEDTVLIICYSTSSAGNSYIYSEVHIKSGGKVVGGLIGYASGVGILFDGDWSVKDRTPLFRVSDDTRVELSSSVSATEFKTSFVGGVIGVLGENATLESTNYPSTGSSVTRKISYNSVSSLYFNGDFAGSIAGYVASTAGVYLGSDSTLMGDNIQFLNSNAIYGGSYVGGMFGAVGRVNFTTGDTALDKLIKFGKYDSSVSSAVTSSLRIAPTDNLGKGKLINYGSVTGSGDCVGGIFGYVGDGVLLYLVNPVFSAENYTSGDSYLVAEDYMVAYNGIKEIDDYNPANDTNSPKINGANYVGGIAGHLSSAAHTVTRIVSRSDITASGSYAGGLFGEMMGGTVLECMAIGGAVKIDGTADSFKGVDYVGGIAGMLSGGTVKNSLTRDFKFENVSVTRGGVVGGALAGSTVEASWTIYITKSPDYSSTSANPNGKFVIIDQRVVSKPVKFREIASMIGLIGDGVMYMDSTTTAGATVKGKNDAKFGSISLRTEIPSSSIGLENYQLVYYDASGLDQCSNTVFEVFLGENGMIYYRFDTKTADSFSICVKEIEFKDVPRFTGASNSDAAKKVAQNAYRAPASGDNRYTVSVGTAIFEQELIKNIVATAYFRNGTKNVVVGNFNKTFTVGDASTPYIIKDQTDWNNFASAVKGGKTYSGEYVKLADTLNGDIKVTASNLAGDISQGASGSSVSNNFRGTFDGNGHYITINITGSSAARLSLFPNAQGATFKNLTVKGSISTSNYDVAAFVAKPFGTLTFENCTSEVNIKGMRTAGGFVGYSNGRTINITTCVNKGDIETDDPVTSTGDFVADDNDTKLYASDDPLYGGIPDFANYSYGTGGIIGFANNAITIDSCKNEGNIRAGYNVGGILGQNDKDTYIYNCANIGDIFADCYWKNEQDYANHAEGGTYRFAYAGGILGKVGQNGSLHMYASYNSGTVTGFGSIVGGLAGSVGYLKMAKGESDKGIAGAKSVIAYCYNTGAVNASGTSDAYDHKSTWYQLGREELNGSLVGGIVGFIAWGDVNYCYNTGKISTYRIIGYLLTWQSRIGGIAGQAQPTGSNYTVSFNYCYNVGMLYVNTYQFGAVGGWARAKPYWGGGICGYLDKGNDKTKLSSSYCYTIANYLHTKIRDEEGNLTRFYYDEWTSESLNSVAEDDKARYVVGEVVDSIDKFTAYMNADGKLAIDRPIGANSDVTAYNSASTLITSSGADVNYKSTSSNFYKGTAYGYVYIYGCLPQLAVFGVGTKEGLSMLSKSYGRDDYGDFKASRAGSKESPYIIKDTVDLFGMSALTGATSSTAITGGTKKTYTFDGKYIEFANGDNNISGMKAKFINMDMSTSDSSMKSGSASGTYNQSGKSYYLWEQSAASGRTSLRYGASPTGASTLRSNWYNKNYYYAGGNSWVNGSAYNSNVNFYPIGYKGGDASFMGNLSGAQGSGNTTIMGLKVSLKNSSNTFAGLLGSTYDATIENITVNGTVNAYAGSSSAKVYAGAIAGYAGGNTIISNCEAGTDEAQVTITAYGTTKDAITSGTLKNYVGGIAGAVGPKKGASDSSSDMKTAEIKNCTSIYATVNTSKGNAGGIVGYAGDTFGNSGLSGNFVKLTDVYVNRTTVQPCDGSTVSGACSDIGGIVGTNDGKVTLIISGAGFGRLKSGTNAYSSYVYGENSLGGIIGTANGNVEIGNVVVSAMAYINRKTCGSGNAVENEDKTYYLTSIGGIVGRTVRDTTNVLRDNITFSGSVNANVATTNSTQSGDQTGNIGGIIGTMGTGTRVLGGSYVMLDGKITSTLMSKVRNVGGVAGTTFDGAFDGYFEIDPEIKAQYAVNVGGVIGLNMGMVDFLASTTPLFNPDGTPITDSEGNALTGTVVNVKGHIKGASDVGGLVGRNGYAYSDGTYAGNLRIGADTYLGGIYDGSVVITLGEKGKSGSAQTEISATGDNVGGLVGFNSVSGTDLGLLLRKGIINNYATISGNNDVGGIVGNNAGDIITGGSTYSGATLAIANRGSVSGTDNIGGVIGYLQQGDIAGSFANVGSVTGNNFVGGSIGRMDKSAIISAKVADTVFVNGGEIAGESSESAVATVSGKKYVGGSIGAMFGIIRANDGFEVSFANLGTVSGENFTGGNIGLLAGSVIRAQLSNEGKVTASGANGIGGSIGIIGAISTESFEHAEIVLDTVHFEFVGLNDVTASGSSSGEELMVGGVGGAIGVIGDKNNGFDNASGNKWKNVTLYTSGGVSAVNALNVGGAIGIIKADNIEIDNMLAFYNKVEGKKNVGGVVGAISGKNVKINNSFNVEGEVVGSCSGGIVGLALTGEGATVADTSYWVKGFANGELMALDIDNIAGVLGKFVYTPVSFTIGGNNVIITKEITDNYSPRQLFADESLPDFEPENGVSNDEVWKTFIANRLGKDVSLIAVSNGVWTSIEQVGDEAHTTGTENTGWYFVYANDKAGLRASHVESGDASHPSVLTDPAKIAEELKYWKRIANAYTAAEIDGTDDTASLTSSIVGIVNGTTVTGGGELAKYNIYAAALASVDNGFYLYMDASGVKPDIWHGTENNDQNFYIDANTRQAENVAVYYRTVSVSGALVYNGYKRYAPITVSVTSGVNMEFVSSAPTAGDGGVSGNYRYMVATTKKDGAAFSGNVFEAGTYTSDVNIYYYDSIGNPNIIGGLKNANWTISPLKLGVELTSANGEYNGKNTTGSITMSVNGVAPLDSMTSRNVCFEIKGDSDNGISGTLDLSKIITSGKTNFDFDTIDDSLAVVNLGSRKIYLAKIEITRVNDITDSRCISDTAYIADSAEARKTYDIKLTFGFSESLKGEFSAKLFTSGISKNYVADEVSTTFDVKPKELTIKMTGNSSEDYNGGVHSTQFKFEGWVAEHSKNATAFVNSLMPYLTYTSKSGSTVGGSDSLWDMTSALSYSLSGSAGELVKATWNKNTDSIIAENMKNEGRYKIGFATTKTYEGKPMTDDGNYYLTVTANPFEFFQITPNYFTLSWGTNSGTYNAKYHNFVVTFTAKTAFDSAEIIANEIRTMFPENYDEFGYSVIEVDNKSVKVSFEVGPNAGTHTVNLPMRRAEDSVPSTENCEIKDAAAGVYTISKLQVSLAIAGSREVVYNGALHEANSIDITAADGSPSWKFNSLTGKYTVTLFEGAAIANEEKDNQFTALLSYAQDGGDGTYAVNVGTYTALLGENAVSMLGADNFEVITSGSGTIKITPASVAFNWYSINTFTYNAKAQGRAIQRGNSTFGDGMSVTSMSYTPQTSNAAAKLVLTNAFKQTETIKIPVGGTPAAIDAGSYVAEVNLANISISGQNAAGAALIGNYDITFTDANNGAYTIKKLRIAIDSMKDSTISKVYDATTSVAKIGTPVFDNTIYPASANYTVTARYDNANVGTGKTITYTVTLKPGTADHNNFDFAGGSSSGTYTNKNGVITARTLTVSLDRLRSSAATRVYNGNVYYGGADGAVNEWDVSYAASAIHRSGEGFTVRNFAVAESSGTVVITAVYKEAKNNRQAFDAFVNNVVGTGSDLSIGTAKRGSSEYFDKKLVFTLSGASASNYNFIVVVGNTTSNIADKVGDSSESGFATVLDGEGGVKIEITANVLKASYSNTAQSYALPDNSYNTDWIDVAGSADAVSGDVLNVVVINNWKYQNNNPATAIPAEYKSHTVIRGQTGSKILSASLSSANGVHVNYDLSNQPVLTIGYFVDKNEFEIGSLASFMIATYYYSVSKSAEDGQEFGEIISQAVWVKVASQEEYASGTGFPTANADGTPFKDAEGNDVTIASWDAYFEYLTGAGGGSRYVFLNENVADAGWGYYATTESSSPLSFDSFKLVANIYGKFTEQDLAILDGMFKRVTVDGEGNIVQDKSYDWGVSGKYLKNFLKGRIGDTLTAIGSIFEGDFGGTFDGNGYVIDAFNIIGAAGAGDNYFGMFSRLDADAIVGGLHLRNVNISISGSGNVFVGMLAGASEAADIANVSAHGSIFARISGKAVVGGIFGTSKSAINGAVALGSMRIDAETANVGGIVGENNGSVENAVSLAEIWTKSTTANVGGIVGSGAAAANSEFMKNSIWLNGSAVAGGVSYSELYDGSVSGYGSASPYYYFGETANASGKYDVLSDVKLSELDGVDELNSAPRESMRLADIIDLYLLMYATSEKTAAVGSGSVRVFERSASSWLVGTAHGTETSKIKIGNQQGIALLRELRFAAFELTSDVHMYSTYQLRTAEGAFFGSVTTNGFAIYVPTYNGTDKVFEVEVAPSAGVAPTEVIKTA